jgi:hypothetical protein
MRRRRGTITLEKPRRGMLCRIPMQNSDAKFRCRIPTRYADPSLPFGSTLQAQEALFWVSVSGYRQWSGGGIKWLGEISRMYAQFRELHRRSNRAKDNPSLASSNAAVPSKARQPLWLAFVDVLISADVAADCVNVSSCADLLPTRVYARLLSA